MSGWWRRWGRRRWTAAGLGAAATALAIGLPTELIPNPLFARMTPAPWWSYPTWLVTAVLAGLLLATYVRDGQAVADQRPAGRGGAGGLLAFLAVGCPVCNKLVVLALGTSGAMTWFAPAQPVLAVGALVLLLLALRERLRADAACAVPATTRL